MTSFYSYQRFEETRHDYHMPHHLLWLSFYHPFESQYPNHTTCSCSYLYMLGLCVLSHYSNTVGFWTSGSAPSQPDVPMLSEQFIYALTISWIKRPSDDEFLLQMEDDATVREARYKCNISMGFWWHCMHCLLLHVVVVYIIGGVLENLEIILGWTFHGFKYGLFLEKKKLHNIKCKHKVLLLQYVCIVLLFTIH